MRLLVTIALLTGLLAAPAGATIVGRQTDGSVVLPTGQRITPFGLQAEMPGTPTGVAISPDSSVALVHAGNGNGAALTAVDLATGKVRGTSPKGVQAIADDGVLYAADGRHAYASDGDGAVVAFEIGADGVPGEATRIALPGATQGSADPGGLARWGAHHILVTLGRANALGVIDTEANRLIATVPVGTAPHSVVAVGDTAYVSNEGGRPARDGDYTQQSAGTPVVADPQTGAATTGTVSVVDLAARRELATIDVGLHPTALLLGKRRLYVANTYSDTVSAIDLASRRVVQTLDARAYEGAALGAMPNGLALLPKGRLAVTLGRANAVAMIDVAHGGRRLGLLPAAWYPAGVAYDRAQRRIVVVNHGGAGAVGDADKGSSERHAGADVGSLSIMRLPSARALRLGTERVRDNNSWDRPAPAAGTPGAAVVPLRAGDRSSPIKHIVYIVKENRTYDQVLGDLGRGNGDPKLAIFGKDITPNHHALATQFPLLDNFYVSGRKSNDGHQWAMQASAPDYLEKQVGNEQRENPIGMYSSPPSSGFDALLYTPGGFLWENVLRHGMSIEDFGEYTFENVTPPARSDVPSLAPYVVPEYAGFELTQPDIQRAAIFRAHLAAHELAGELPTLTLMLLPCDHTGGTNPLFLTPESQLADNDAGLGQIVDAISHSSFWPSTAIFVAEDDAGGGPDHVEGHRSPAYVISPYARRGAVVSTLYTQVDMVRTIEQILGLPAMNPLDAAASPMRDAFQDTPDLTPFDALAPRVTPARNPALGALRGRARAWAQAMTTQDFEHIDEADARLLSRDLWYAMKGYDTTYPGDSGPLTPAQVRAHVAPVFEDEPEDE